ncbi:MAG: hydroxymethylglutaryl-CoA reductase [Abyssibacter sp.]|uniref:hydroxymethylglutaryl-CoA reductase n=1 Tax=Abyssibacter sp. TaxID=2320200 RepID=UPI0032195E44
MSEHAPVNRPRIPRNRDDDYSQDAARIRREFIHEQTGVELAHTGRYSFDPAAVKGNCEHFMGVAQVPLGVAGPVRVNGEHAQGEFYVPMATAEGTLVASYNRGMRLTREAGGITVTVADDAMQRAPVFAFDNAQTAKRFGGWIKEQMPAIRAAAEATTSVGKLRDIEHYAAARFLYLRFNYTTGDAAGQNMCGKATHAACQWILANTPCAVERFSLSGNMDTDKKPSQVNFLHSRGKRVIAECTVPDQLMRDIMGIDSKSLYQRRIMSMTGAFMAGSMNNGAHAANGITATFIATGQDAANVAESCVGAAVGELTDDNGYYFSITLPSLICASYGGGTGLPSQRECLEMMDCYGQGKSLKLAEIIGATVLAGELSLAAAVATGDWVTSHEQYGRNR